MAAAAAEAPAPTAGSGKKVSPKRTRSGLVRTGDGAPTPGKPAPTPAKGGRTPAKAQAATPAEAGSRKKARKEE